MTAPVPDAGTDPAGFLLAKADEVTPGTRASGRRCARAADALRRVLQDPALDLEPEMREQATALHAALTLRAADILLGGAQAYQAGAQ